MKTYINVPFAENARAKALGAMWDMGRKKWYVPDGVDLTPFLQWVPGIKMSAEVAKALRSNRKGEASR